MDGTIDNINVVGAPDLHGGCINDRGAVVGLAQAGGTDVVVTLRDVVSGDELGNGGGDGLERRVRALGHGDQLVHPVGDGGDVAGSLQVARGGEARGTSVSDLEDTVRGKTVSQVGLDLDGVVGTWRDGALDVAGDGVVARHGGPEVEPLAGLGEQTSRPVVEHGGDGGVGRGDGSARLRVERVLGGEGNSEDGVVLDVLANGQLDPVRLSGQGDRDGAALDSLDLCLDTNTRIDQHAGRRQGTTGQNNATAGLEIDNLAAAVLEFDLDTSGGGVGAHDTDELGVERHLEVGLGLGEREVVLDRAGTQTILDQPGRVGEDGLLVVGRGQGVGLREAVVAEEVRHDGPGTLIDTGTVGEDVTRGALVEGVSRGGDIIPLPACGPLVVKVVCGRLDEHHGVDGTGSTQQATSHTGSVETVLASVGGGGQVVSHGGHVVLSDGVVVCHGVITSRGVVRSWATLQEQDGCTRLSQTLRGNDTGSTTTGNNVVVSGVASGGRRCGVGATGGGVRSGGGSADGTSVGAGSQGSPGGVLG